MSYTITLIPGDGIGPEVTSAMRRCVDALGLDIKWETALAGEPALRKFNTLLPEETINSVKRNKVAIKGPIITPVGSGFRSINVAIRQSLNLFACLRPARSIKGVPHSKENVDIVIVRENSEDLYSGIEFFIDKPETKEVISSIEKYSSANIREDSAISIKPISKYASLRISKFAFDLARREGRKKVSCIHKANIMKATDGLFLASFREIAHSYPDIEAEDIIIDNFCMQLVRRPRNFDVLVLPNLYGDIISDLCAGLVGGLGVTPGANIGDEFAVFEPVHGAAPKYTGKDKVNPTATILSGAMMLKYLGEIEAARILERAVAEIIEEGEFVTYDLKYDRNDPDAVSTTKMTDAIVERIEKLRGV